MKALSVLMTLSFLASAAFADSNVLKRVADISCDTNGNSPASISTSISGASGHTVIAKYVVKGEVKTSTYEMTMVSLGVGDQEGLTLKGTGADGDLDLLLDVNGKAGFYKLNDIDQPTADLVCKIKFNDSSF